MPKRLDGFSWSAKIFKNYRLYLTSGILLLFAAQVQTLVVGWQVYEIKHDPLYLGFIGLIEALPALCLALFSGYVVDRSNPLTVFKNVVRLALLSSCVLLLISSPWIAPQIGVNQRLVILYFCAFISGIARGFRMPATMALVPVLVPREALSHSSAWSTAGTSAASTLGPALGGILFSFTGPVGPYGINVLALLTASVLLLRIRFNHQARVAATKTATSMFDNITAGLRYVWSHELLFPALTLDMLAVLFGGVVALLPIFAAEILKVGTSGLGILRASASLGALIGSFAIVKFPFRKNSGKILLGCVAGFGFCMVGFGLSRSFGFSLVLLALGGGFDSVSMVIRGAIVQLSSPPEMRGRIGAVNSMFIGVSNQLGEFESGVMAKLLGTAPSVVFGGIITLLIVSIASISAKKLRRMELIKL